MKNRTVDNARSVAEKKFRSFQLIEPLKNNRKVFNFLSGLGILFLVIMLLPWQQNIKGVGSIIAFNPEDRPQSVQTITGGRIDRWYIREGQYVKKNDTLVVLSEVKERYMDPKLLERLGEQVTAKTTGVESSAGKIVALDKQIKALEQGMVVTIEQARNKLNQARLKLVSDSMDMVAARVEAEIAKQQFLRQQALYEEGLKSLSDLEARKLKMQESSAKAVSAVNKLAASRNEVENAVLELSAKNAEYSEKIAKAKSDRESAQAYMAENEGDLSKLKNEYSNMAIRQNLYVLRAPQDGFITRALKAGIGETLKEGESIASIMPSNPSLSVELFVDAMDVPLLSKGGAVRIQFEGWPAIQFSGWPAVSVGTFGGKVAVIDYVASDNGKYRLLVKPDRQDQQWPAQLRVGSAAYGWVMLKTVPVWFEIWRQLNGFPPQLNQDPKKVEK